MNSDLTQNFIFQADSAPVFPTAQILLDPLKNVLTLLLICSA